MKAHLMKFSISFVIILSLMMLFMAVLDVFQKQATSIVNQDQEQNSFFYQSIDSLLTAGDTILAVPLAIKIAQSNYFPDNALASIKLGKIALANSDTLKADSIFQYLTANFAIFTELEKMKNANRIVKFDAASVMALQYLPQKNQTAPEKWQRLKNLFSPMWLGVIFLFAMIVVLIDYIFPNQTKQKSS